MRLGRFVALFLIASILTGAKLYLKTRVIDTSESAPEVPLQPLMIADAAQPTHVLVQFDHPPSDDDLQRLVARGATIAGYVHEDGLVISILDPSLLADLNLVWVGRMDASDKVSPLLADDGSGELHAVLVEFYFDVPMDSARRLVSDAGFVYLDNPDAGPHRLLVILDSTQMAALAARDEVAYLFPAEDDLVTGRPVIACGGALTGAGYVGQYIATVGNGWGGVDHKAAALGYYFAQLTSQLPADSARSEILRAFNEWARYVQVSFSPAAGADLPQSINVMFALGDHGDGYPFDGHGGVLAHTFYPAPPNPEPLAGDMHLDDTESWRTGADTDLFSVALHEAGHALGLGHSDRPGTVMYPYYSRVTGLTSDDITAIQKLYPARTSSDTPDTPAPAPSPLTLTIAAAPLTTTADSITLAGTSGGGEEPRTVSWISDRGRSGTATGSASWTALVPLANGANTITVTVADSQARTLSKSVAVARQAASPTPVTVQITSPSTTGIFRTNQSAVSLRGTASHPSGIQAVRWVSDRGPSGMASGTASWDTGTIMLQSGSNYISVTAIANDGTSATRAMLVSYSSNPSGGGSPDTTAPSINITYPASATSSTTASTAVVRGTARDNVGVTAVTWSTTAGDSGSASGTASWVTSPIPLIYGYNSIRIRATDAAGNTGWRNVIITRR